MAKNLDRFYLAWELRQQGLKLSEIADSMGFKSGEHARRMIYFIDSKIASNKIKTQKLKELIQRYHKEVSP